MIGEQGRAAPEANTPAQTPQRRSAEIATRALPGLRVDAPSMSEGPHPPSAAPEPSVPPSVAANSSANVTANSSPRWCARLGFVRDVWSGRPRVILDVELEASLREPRRLSPGVVALLGELVPERSNSVWLLAERPGDLPGPRRRGVHAIDEFEGLLAQTPWEVAVVDLARSFVDAASLSRFAARARGRLENRLETRAFRLLSALAEGAAQGRSVIVSTPAASRGGLSLSDFQDLLEQHFPRARVYALAAVAVAVAVDCGEVVREDEDEGDPGEEQEEDDEAPPLAFDNRLGEDLRYDTYVALINAPGEPLGVTLVELPAAAEPARAEPARAEPVRPGEASRPSVGRNDAEVDNLKIQLGQARRQVELAAIARQSLVEQLDAAQARVDSLEDQLAELQRRLTAAPAETRMSAAEAPRPAVDPRPDATQATVLSLRWELEQTREELRKALGRPVEALEREVAELRARLGSTDPTSPD